MFEEIRGAIFDLDGTILDSLPVWKVLPALYLEQFGIKADPELPRQVYHLTFEEGAAFIKKQYSMNLDAEEIKKGILAAADRQYAEIIPAKKEVLKIIRGFRERGIPMAVASSASRLHVETSLKRLGILEWFSGIFCSSEIGKSKSDPSIYLMAAESIGTAPDETCVFEDALFAARTAKNAGFKTCGVYDESTVPDWEELSALADYTC